MFLSLSPQVSSHQPLADYHSDTHMDFVVLGYKGVKRRTVDENLLMSSINYCLERAQSSLVIVRDKFDVNAFAKNRCVDDVLRSVRARPLFSNYGGSSIAPKGMESGTRQLGRSGTSLGVDRPPGCHILVPVDFHPASEKALLDALHLSQLEQSLPNFSKNIQRDDRITVLFVVSEDMVVANTEGREQKRTELFEGLIKTSVERVFGPCLRSDAGAEERCAGDEHRKQKTREDEIKHRQAMKNKNAVWARSASQKLKAEVGGTGDFLEFLDDDTKRAMAEQEQATDRDLLESGALFKEGTSTTESIFCPYEPTRRTWVKHRHD